MHSDHPFLSRKPMLPLGDQVGYYMQNGPISSVFNGLVPSGINIKPPAPFHNLDINPSDACPRNFIIFDQTNNRSQIMYHPEINSRMFHPGFGVETSLLQENIVPNDTNDEGKLSSELKEDSNDIDALLSTEYEDDEESGDEVSTARTNAIYECSSPDSCSNYETGSRKRLSLYKKRGNEKKRERMRKMVKALRGIVPGANQMSTVAVLDEAVRYLKSLRVEVKKMGVGKSM